MRFKVGLLFLFAVVAAIFVKPVFAIEGALVDPDFTNAVYAGANGNVNSMAVLADGKILIGGDFTGYGGVAIPKLARLNSDGSLDTNFNVAGTGVNGSVNTIVVQSDGKIVIGGVFYDYNNVSRGSIARLNSDGTLDTGFLATGDGTNTVSAIAVQADGKIVIGGGFTAYNGITRNGIARLNSDGSLDSGFLSTGDGANSSVASLAIQSDGKIVIGGYFTTYNSTARNRIARLNTDGSLDSGFLSSGAGANGTVNSLVIQSDGKIVIGGWFTSYNSTSRGYIARLNTDGSLDSGYLGVGAGASYYVSRIAIQTDDKVVIVGGFSSYNGTSRIKVARINVDGTLDSSFIPSGVSINYYAFVVNIQTDGKILFAGSFTNYDGVSRDRVVRVNGTDGSLDTGFLSTGTGANDVINSVAVQSDGKIIVGGAFTHFNGAARGGIARLSSAGLLDTDFLATGAGVNGTINSLAMQADGKIVIVGEFTTYNGVSRRGIARINSDGSLDTGFAVGTGVDTDASALAIQSDGKVVIGGTFTSYNGMSRNRVARLNTDGSLDSGFLSSGAGANADVYNIKIQSDGKIIIGGNFTTYNGVSRGYLARLNTDGSLDSGFLSTGAGANANVRSIAFQADGQILIGGGFNSYNGTARGGIARLNTDGSLDGSFLATDFGANTDISSVLVQTDGKIAIAGYFTYFNWSARGHVARLNSDGTLTGFLSTGAGADTNVFSLAEQADGKLLAAGAFTIFNSAPSAFITRLVAQTLPDPTPTPIPGYQIANLDSSLNANFLPGDMSTIGDNLEVGSLVKSELSNQILAIVDSVSSKVLATLTADMSTHDLDWGNLVVQHSTDFMKVLIKNLIGLDGVTSTADLYLEKNAPFKAKEVSNLANSVFWGRSVKIDDNNNIAVGADGGDGNAYVYLWNNPSEFSKSTISHTVLLSENYLPASGNSSEDTSVQKFGNDKFVATWTVSMPSSSAILAKIVDSDGNDLSGDIVLIDNANTKHDPAASELINNKFMITWYENVGGSMIALAQYMNVDGSKIGSVFEVSDTLSHSADDPDVAALSNGKFVFVFYDGNGENTYYRIWDPNTSDFTSAAVLVDLGASNFAGYYQSVAADDNGGFAVIIGGYFDDGVDYFDRAYLQIFNSSLTPVYSNLADTIVSSNNSQWNWDVLGIGYSQNSYHLTWDTYNMDGNYDGSGIDYRKVGVDGTKGPIINLASTVRGLNTLNSASIDVDKYGIPIIVYTDEDPLNQWKIMGIHVPVPEVPATIVGICPDALTLTDISSNCTNLSYRQIGDSNIAYNYPLTSQLSYKLSNITSGGVFLKAPPTVAITDFPVGQNTNDVVEISWNDLGDNVDGTISFYYDIDNTGLDGTLFTTGYLASSSTNTANLDLSTVPDGTYYIYATVSDGVYPSYSSYSPTTFTRYGYVAPTPTPTAVPANQGSTSSSSNNSSSGGSTSTACGNSKPTVTTDLFQINVNKTSAQLYFTPVADADNFFISFATTANAEEHGTNVYLAREGVQNFKVNLLKPNTTYYFKVRANNGCMPGEWSQILKVKTLRSETLKPVINYKSNSVVKKIANQVFSNVKQSSMKSPAKTEVSTPPATPTPIVRTEPPAVDQVSTKNCFLWWCW